MRWMTMLCNQSIGKAEVYLECYYRIKILVNIHVDGCMHCKYSLDASIKK